MVVDLYEVRIICQPSYLMNPTRPDFKFLLETKIARTELNLYGLCISRGDVRGRVREAYRAYQVPGNDRAHQ